MCEEAISAANLLKVVSAIGFSPLHVEKSKLTGGLAFGAML
jgi:hypothetical protein